MTRNFFRARSLKTRVTLATLSIFLLGVWSLAFYVSHMLRRDMQRLFGEQQFSTVSFIAASMDHELADRLVILKEIAGGITPVMMNSAATLQTLLERRPILRSRFSGGVIVYGPDGTALAEVPLDAGRIGVNYLDIDSVTAALREGRSSISRPLIGKKLHAAVFGMTVPVRDHRGSVIGALSGVINLGMPGPLDAIATHTYGKTGGYLLLAPQYRLIVTATDKSRVMEELPAEGTNPILDRYLRGEEGYGIVANRYGGEDLMAVKGIPVAGWAIAAVTPTAEAFAPIHAMQQRMLAAALFLTLLAGGLIWWMLRRELAPMSAAVKALDAMSDAGRLPSPLPGTTHDEIGRLIKGFNRLLEVLRQRELALRDSELKFRSLAESSADHIMRYDRECRHIYVNPAGLAACGMTAAELIGKTHVEAGLAADQTSFWEEKIEQVFACAEPYEVEFTWRGPKGSVCLDWRLTPELAADGSVQSVLGVSRDITDRKRAEQREQFRSRILELLAEGRPLQHILEAIARGLEQFNPALRCAIALFDERGMHLRVSVAPGLGACGAHVQAGPGAPATDSAAGLHAAFTHSGDSSLSVRFADHPDWVVCSSLAANAGMRAGWSQPFRSAAGGVLGALTIFHDDAYTPSDAKILLIEECARLASVAIENDLAAAKLRDSEAHYRLLTEDVSDVVWKQDCNNVFTYISPADEALRGYRADEVIGRHVTSFLTDEGIALLKKANGKRRAAERQGTPIGAMTLELQQRCRDGRLIWTEVVSMPERDADGSIVGYHGISRNITERKQAEEKLHLAASVFTHAREGIMITSADGKVIDVNQAFTTITGYSRDDVLGRNPRLLSSGRHDKAFYVELWRELIGTGHWYGEIWNRRKSGEIYAEMKTISAVRDARGITRHYVALFSDITALKEHERQLEHIAHYDALTSLPNRVLLADRMHQAMAQTQRHGRRLAVAYLDLDGFKAINDRHGHHAGDQLLMCVASRMKHALREGDTFARLGGDEFVAVLLDVADIAASAPTLARLIAAAAQPVRVGELVLQVSASLGVTVYPQPEDVDADQLLRQADQAMYQAKLAGKNRYRVFDAEQDRSVRGHHESLGRMRRALEEREFVLHYQPMVNMRTGRVVGAEALIRWQHPEKGLLPPAVFLPVIEDDALAVELGEWVIDTALVQVTRWAADGLRLPVSVNVGARSLQQSDFVDRLRAILAAHPGIAPGDLELEVLETSALEDLGQVSAIIDGCRNIGVRFALDDFGTGYSSLTYLKRLSVAQLKIDQSFVRGMLDDPDDLAILEGVLCLATAFRRQVVAEGVETVEHGEMLLQLGCELAQGYGIARPMPADALPGWAAAWRPDPAWSDRAAVSRDDLPLIFAGVEHRAWVAAMENHLHGGRAASPTLDIHECRFGRWLETEGQARHAGESAFRAADSLHRRVHALAQELSDLCAHGQNAEALARIGELHALRDALLGQLNVLVRENGCGGA